MTFSPEWLALREPADAAARADGLLVALRAALPRDRLVVRDVGCGTGSMARWLSPRLPAPQHWVLHDLDPALLAIAERAVTAIGATAETVAGDLSALGAADLAGTDLLTASALLDLLTAGQITALAAACARTPALLTLSVTGRVDFSPADPLDAAIGDAFNDHQRRPPLLGPDAVRAAVAAFEAAGSRVLTAPSPWRLGRGALTAEWLRGWVAAAVEQRPELADAASAYLDRRLAADLRVQVQHLDLLALPAQPERP